MINTGALSFTIHPPKARRIGGVGNTLVLSLGPITGGVGPYEVDFSHMATLGTRSREQLVEFGAALDALVDVSVAGSGILEGGTAYATAKVHEGQLEGAMLYFPPGSYISVTDTAGNSAIARLSAAGFQILNIPWEE